jgi:4'-phosphopantetheinyl transferase
VEETPPPAAACPSVLEWNPSATAPLLGEGELHLWKAVLCAGGEERLVDALTPEERGRALALASPRARASYVQGRGLARRVLGLYLDLPPQGVRFRYGPRGKPFLAATPDLQFNLTHSAELCLMAVMRGAEVGVDAEKVRALRYADAIAARLFGPGRARGLRALAAAERPAAFMVSWTRLEAGVKALGGGLFDPPSRSVAGLSLASFRPHPGFLASVAVRGVCPRLGRWRAYRLPAEGPVPDRGPAPP